MNRQDHLMEEHLNCVHWVIHSFIHVSPGVCGLEYDDLYQEGCIALWRAAETYDEQLGAQFHSYAISVIRNHLVDYCRKIQGRTTPGHFRRRTTGLGQSYPVIIINQKEYCVDIQEMALWTALNWRLLDFPQIQAEYEKLERDCVIPARRTLENCLGRLCTRGLVASGTGETDFEALYDLLGGLYVVPLSESLPLKLTAFLKLTVQKGEVLLYERT